MLRLIAFCACLLAGPVYAQTNVNLGGIAVDTSAAIEVTADSLSVDQENPIMIMDSGKPVGVVTKDALLRGIQGEV